MKEHEKTKWKWNPLKEHEHPFDDGAEHEGSLREHENR